MKKWHACDYSRGYVGAIRFWSEIREHIFVPWNEIGDWKLFEVEDVWNMWLENDFKNGD